jgi:hypothetical protein
MENNLTSTQSKSKGKALIIFGIISLLFTLVMLICFVLFMLNSGSIPANLVSSYFVAQINTFVDSILSGAYANSMNGFTTVLNDFALNSTRGYVIAQLVSFIVIGLGLLLLGISFLKSETKFGPFLKLIALLSIAIALLPFIFAYGTPNNMVTSLVLYVTILVSVVIQILRTFNPSNKGLHVATIVSLILGAIASAVNLIFTTIDIVHDSLLIIEGATDLYGYTDPARTIVIIAIVIEDFATALFPLFFTIAFFVAFLNPLNKGHKVDEGQQYEIHYVYQGEEK